MTLKEAIETGAVNAVALSQILGVSHKSVYNWAHGTHKIKMHDAKRIEEATGGIVNEW